MLPSKPFKRESEKGNISVTRTSSCHFASEIQKDSLSFAGEWPSIRELGRYVPIENPSGCEIRFFSQEASSLVPCCSWYLDDRGASCPDTDRKHSLRCNAEALRSGHS